MAVSENYTDNTLVSGTSLADLIVNGHRYYDYYRGLKATIDTSKGNDTIYNDVNEVSVNGGTDNDYIDNQFGFRLFGLSTRFASDYVPTSDQISKPDNSTLIGGDGNDLISLVSTSHLIQYASGGGNDTIVNDYFWNSEKQDAEYQNKVTISGGAGNDSLWGDAGADKFIYAKDDGSDVIFGFANEDTLTIDNLAFTSSYKDNTLTLTFDSSSVMFKEFTVSTFHIDNDTYKISGSKLKKQ